MNDGIDIASARLKSGMTVIELAKSIGVSQDRMMKIEANPATLSTRLASLIASSLGMEIDDINFSSLNETSDQCGVRMVSDNSCVYSFCSPDRCS